MTNISEMKTLFSQFMASIEVSLNGLLNELVSIIDKIPEP